MTPLPIDDETFRILLPIIITISVVGIIVGLAANGIAWMGVFKKAGKPAWAGFVPFYNIWVMLEVAGRPQSWFWMYLGGTVLSAIPFAGLLFVAGLIVLQIFLMNDIAKSFGKDAAWTVGLFFLPVIFAAILSFGEARYLGPGALMGPREAQGYPGQPHYGAPQQAPQQYGAQGTYGTQGHYGAPQQDSAPQQYGAHQQYGTQGQTGPAAPPYQPAPYGQQAPYGQPAPENPLGTPAQKPEADPGPSGESEKPGA